MIFKDVEQNTDEWFDLRKGVPTSSKLGIIMANYGKSFGEPAKKYAFRLAKEQVTGEIEQEESYNNKYMELGHVYEPVARSEYELKTFYNVSNGGFCKHENYNFGGSPDGLVNEFKGGIEIKSVIDWTHRKTIKRNSFDPSYKWQLIGNMWLCDLEWIDFVSYGYNYTDNKKLFINMLNKDDFKNEFKMIETRLKDFLKLIEEEKKYL